MRLHLSLLSLLLIAGCTPTEPMEEATSTEADVEAINRASEEFVAAIKANDTEGLVSLYTADAVLMPPNDAAAKGSEAVRAWMQSFLDQFTMEDFTISTEEITVADDWAFRSGTFAMTASPAAGGEQIEDAGKFIEIWQRQADCSWKMAWDIWNSDNPPAGQ